MTILRPPAWQRLIIGALGVALAGGLAVGGVDDGGWILPACLAGSVLVLAGTWRNDRMRVELGRAVVVVNFFRTLVVPWSEIDRFGYDGEAWVRRRDGRQHEISVFTPPTGSLSFVERRCQDAVRTMEAHRKRRRR